MGFEFRLWARVEVAGFRTSHFERLQLRPNSKVSLLKGGGMIEKRKFYGSG